jgi:hypothetical protein
MFETGGLGAQCSTMHFAPPGLAVFDVASREQQRALDLLMAMRPALLTGRIVTEDHRSATACGEDFSDRHHGRTSNDGRGRQR